MPLDQISSGKRSSRWQISTLRRPLPRYLASVLRRMRKEEDCHVMMTDGILLKVRENERTSSRCGAADERLPAGISPRFRKGKESSAALLISSGCLADGVGQKTRADLTSA